MSVVAASNDPQGVLDVDDQVAEITGLLNVQHAQLVRVVAEALESNVWSGAGIHTPVQWLGLRAGLSASRARQVVAIAQRAAEFPNLMAAFDAGTFTLDQVAIIVKAPAWADDHVLEFAQVATLSQLRRAMRDRFFDDGTPEPQPSEKSPKDRLSFGVTGDGARWRISGELDLLTGRRIEAALAEAKDSLFDAGDHTATWCDALVEVAERSLDAVESAPRRDRYRSWLHLDVTDGVATTTDGWRLPPAVRDQILCDGVVQPVWETSGSAFNAGRAQRVVSDRLRRLVERRDQGCCVPGCTNSRYLEIHHIVHWADGGRTDSNNLVCLCPKHHRAHHQGVIDIVGNPDIPGDLVVSDSGGPICGRRPRPARHRHPQPPDQPYCGPLGQPIDWHRFGGWVHPDELERRRTARRQRWNSD